MVVAVTFIASYTQRTFTYHGEIIPAAAVIEKSRFEKPAFLKPNFLA
jgi:hypothetical protein